MLTELEAGIYSSAGVRKFMSIANRKIDDRNGIANSCNHLGRLACATGDLTTARAYLQETLTTAVALDAAPIVLLQQDQVAESLELVALAIAHPSIAHVTHQEARQLATSLIAQLPPDVAAQVHKCGAQQSLEWAIRLFIGV